MCTCNASFVSIMMKPRVDICLLVATFVALAVRSVHGATFEYRFYDDNSMCTGDVQFAMTGLLNKCVTTVGEGSNYALYHTANNTFYTAPYADSACTIVSGCGNQNCSEPEPLASCNLQEDSLILISSESATSPSGSSAIPNPVTLLLFSPGNTDCSGPNGYAYTQTRGMCGGHMQSLFSCSEDEKTITVTGDCSGTPSTFTYAAGVCTNNLFVDSDMFDSFIPICGRSLSTSTITPEQKAATVATVAATVATATATSVATSIAVAVVAPALTSSVGASVSSTAAAPAAGGNLMGMIASVQTLALVGGLASAPASFSDITESLEWMNLRFKLPFSSSSSSAGSGRRLTSDSATDPVDLDKILGTWFWAGVSLVTVMCLRYLASLYFGRDSADSKYAPIAMEEGGKKRGKSRFNFQAVIAGLLLFPRWEGPAVMFLLPGVGQSIGEAISSADDWLIVVGTILLLVYPVAFLVAVGIYLHKRIYTTPAVRFVPHNKPLSLKGFVLRDKDSMESGEWVEVGSKFKSRYGFLFTKQTFQRFGFLYNVLETLRVLLIAVLCGALHNSNGCVQSAILFSLSLLSFCYCVIVRPFNDKIANFVQACTVGSQAAIFLVTLLVAIDVVSPSYSEDILMPIGFGGIGAQLLNQLTTALLTVVSLVNRLQASKALQIPASGEMVNVVKVVVQKGAQGDDAKNIANTARGQQMYMAIESAMTRLRAQFTEKSLEVLLNTVRNGSNTFSSAMNQQDQFCKDSIDRFVNFLNKSQQANDRTSTASLGAAISFSLKQTVESELNRINAKGAESELIAYGNRYVDKIVTDVDHIWANLHRKLFRVAKQTGTSLSQAAMFHSQSAESIQLVAIAISLANQLLVELRMTLAKSRTYPFSCEPVLFESVHQRLEEHSVELQAVVEALGSVTKTLWREATKQPESALIQLCTEEVDAILVCSTKLKASFRTGLPALCRTVLSTDATPKQSPVGPDREVEMHTPLCQNLVALFQAAPST